MNNKILFFGDVHGNFRHVFDVVGETRPEAIVFLGDLEAPGPLDEMLAPIAGKTTIRFIHGNHDTDSDKNVENLLTSRFSHLNLHGRVETIAGVRVAGLGGIFRGEVWRPPMDPVYASYEAYLAAQESRQFHRQGHKGDSSAATILAHKARTHKSTIFPNIYDELAYVETADVLVVHEAPSCHPMGFAAIDELARALGVRSVFHGHHHDRLPYADADADADNRLGFRVHGVGFCGVTDLDGGIVRIGDFDEQRMNRTSWDNFDNDASDE